MPIACNRSVNNRIKQGRRLTIHELDEGPNIVKYRSLFVSFWGILSANVTLPSPATNPAEGVVETAVVVDSRAAVTLSVSNSHVPD
jgi:hypothetical protein